MRLDSIFSKTHITEIKAVFSVGQIDVPDNFEFSNFNIIIGPNGSGKTRFLKAIKNLYDIYDEDINIIYSYFPLISSEKEPPKPSMPEYSLFEYFWNEDAPEFSDFFREIESQCNGTFIDLSNYNSNRNKERKEALFNTIKNIFNEFTQKELIKKKKKYYVKTSENKSHLLSDELKRMSPGERVLLYMSFFIALQKKNEKKKVIILDEPESHLHPKALISFINFIKKLADDNVMCWIATHSLFLIPWFEFENIVYIKNGQIQNRTSQLYHNIYSDMLGDENGEVKAFFSSLPYWQYYDFICKCFTPPIVIESINPEDEQVKLFKKYLDGIENNAFRVLDWGGGSGRLGSSLKASWSNNSSDFHYEIYDPKPKYNCDNFKVYSDLKDIEGSYDCIVMMNVLHEIDPNNWCDLFSNIHRFLKEDTYLFFVEVKALSQGEMPNENGYFVLGKPELELLFRDNKLTEFTLADTTIEDQKSSCVPIPQKSLTNINEDSIRRTIQNLKDRMFTEIINFRNTFKKDKTNLQGANGRKYAYLLQQYMNAALFIEQCTKKANHFSKLQMELTKLMVKYDKVRCYGGRNVIWKGKKALPDELYKKIKASARSFSTLRHNNKEYLFINLCEQQTSQDDVVIVFDSLESEIEYSVDISDAYLERVYSLYHDNTESFLDEKMKLNVHMHYKGNIVSIPIAYACHHNGSTSVLLHNVLSNSDAQNKEINLIESPSEAGSIIGFSETAYCVRCVTTKGNEFHYTLYMKNDNGYFKYKLSKGEEDYQKYYEIARQNMKKEIEITKKYRKL